MRLLVKVKLSIIIATRNRQHLLLKTLQLLAPQLEDGDNVIISDASELGMSIEVKKLINKYAQKITWLANTTVTLTANRNFAMKYINCIDADFWCFFDDDLLIDESYLSTVRSHAKTIEDRTAFTGLINSDKPNLPNYLGFYRRSSISERFVRMPHSVGTWIPTKGLPLFNYEYEDFFGYDELELRDYLTMNSINIELFENLIIKHDIHEFASLRKVKKTTLDKIRIIQNVRSMRRTKKSLYRIATFIIIATTHSFLSTLAQFFRHFNSIFINIASKRDSK